MAENLGIGTPREHLAGAEKSEGVADTTANLENFRGNFTELARENFLGGKNFNVNLSGKYV